VSTPPDESGLKTKPENTIIGGFVLDANQNGYRYPVIVEPPRAKNLEMPDADAGAERLEKARLRQEEIKAKRRALGESARGYRLGDSPLAGKKSKLSVLGISPAAIDKADPAWVACIKAANAYRRSRNKELYIAHGYVSAGASALLATAALALAASRYLYERMSFTGDIALLKQASQLGDAARQNELAAWELCAREAVSRRKHTADQSGVPWLRVQDGGEKKRGRPKLTEPLVNSEALTVTGSTAGDPDKL